MIHTTASQFVDCFKQPSALIVLKKILVEQRLYLRGGRLLTCHVAEKISCAKTTDERFEVKSERKVQAYTS